MVGGEVIETDILCVGGGIAGLMAAIRAAELGAQVVVAEKGNTLTSGAGGMGNDPSPLWRDCTRQAMTPPEAFQRHRHSDGSPGKMRLNGPRMWR